MWSTHRTQQNAKKRESQAGRGAREGFLEEDVGSGIVSELPRGGPGATLLRCLGHNLPTPSQETPSGLETRSLPGYREENGGQGPKLGHRPLAPLPGGPEPRVVLPQPRVTPLSAAGCLPFSRRHLL